MFSHRRTLGQSFSLAGEGVRSGRPVSTTLEPAESGTGLVLTSLDLNQEWPLDLDHTVAIAGCTAAGSAEANIPYVEHFLAACRGVGLTDARLTVAGPEIPLLDGSARPWLEAMVAAGLRELPEALAPLEVTDTVMVVSEHAMAAAFPSAEATIFYLLEQPHPLIGRQFAAWLDEPGEFAVHVAPARTFTTVEEAEQARARGLMLGGSEENALVLYPDRLSADPGLPEPCARHKLLDLIGDLYLLGRPVQGSVLAHNTGHRLHHRFAEALAGHAASGEPQFVAMPSD